MYGLFPLHPGWFGEIQSLLAILESLVELRKQMGVVTGFCPKDKSQIVVDKISDMGAVGAEPNFDHYAFQMRMILSEFDKKTTGSISLAILLGSPILHDNKIRGHYVVRVNIPPIDFDILLLK
ncbi:MAG: hypothetical protein GY799_12410 [Desulfobulbaceae bacterium]|nr:hypothetical protein [Desulfobulbaceae bacterium]